MMYIKAAIKAVTGMVRSQAIRIWDITPQRTLLRRSADPTPKMAELTTWVVLTGPPSRAAPRITPAALICVLKPCTGLILKNFAPRVLIKRHPPIKVPREMAPALAAITQVGTSKVLSYPIEMRATVMIPIVFWASLAPWLNPRPIPVNTWAFLNNQLIRIVAFCAKK